MKKVIIAVTILALIVTASVYCYVRVANDACPLCGAHLETAEKVMREGKTSFRYTCSEHTWHFIDLPFRIR